MSRLRIVCAMVVALDVLGSSGVQAQPSFAGTWKLNLPQSQLTGQTLSIEKTASGLLALRFRG